MQISGIGKHVVILALYSFLTVFMTWPAIATLSSQIVGAGGDPWQTMWRFDDKAASLSEAREKGELGQFIKEEFLGGGPARLINLSTWPWAPLEAIVGLPVAYNLIVLLSFVLSGYAMYLFVSTLLPAQTDAQQSWWVQEAPAFLAGLYYMFLPYHIAHAQGHFGAMQIMWLPFIGWAALRWWQSTRPWYVVFLGLFLTVQAWTEHHYMLWIAIFAVVVAIFFWREILAFVKHPKQLGWVVGLMVWVIVTILFAYYPTIRLAQEAQETLDVNTEQVNRFSSDLFAFIFPASFHPGWGSLSASFFNDDGGNVAEGTHYMGVSVLLLLLFFHQHTPSRVRTFWLTVAGVFLLISLGPTLKVFGHQVLPIMPYALISELPIFTVVRAVGRASIIIGMALTVLLAWVFKTQLRRPGSALVIATILLIDFLFFPFFSMSATLPAVYTHIQEAPGSRIIEIPAPTNYSISSRGLYASIFHGKEVLGNIALERGEDTKEVEMLRSVPALRQLLYMGTGTLRQDRADFFEQPLAESLVDALRYYDVGAIVIHTDSLSSLQVASVRNFLETDIKLIPTLIEDTVLYTFNPATLSVPADGVFLMRDRHWLHVGYDPIKDSVFAEVEEQATITLVNTREVVQTVKLEFSTASSSTGYFAVRQVVPGDRAQTLLTSTIGSRESLNITLPVGETELVFSAEGGKAILQNPVLTVVR